MERDETSEAAGRPGIARGATGTRAAARVGAARLRGRPWQAVLVVAGVAAATALLAGILGGSLTTENRALRQSVARLPGGDRSFRADLFGLSVQQPLAKEDAAARRALASLGGGAPVRVVFFHDALVDGQLVRLVGVDGLSRFVSVTAGRLPQRCDPGRCEVLQLGGRGRPTLDEGGLHLVRTAVGDVRDPSALGPALEGLHTYGTQEGVRSPIVLMTASSSALERLPALRLLFRVRSWIVPLAPSSLRSWLIDGLLARESVAQTALHEADPAFKLSGPDSALVQARDAGRVAAHRMVILGASAFVLLFGFVAVAGLGLRRGIAGERRRLLQRGATEPQAWTAVLVEIGALTLVAWALGLALGFLAVAALAHVAGLPAGPILQHAFLEPSSILVLVLAWAATAVVVATTTGSRGPSGVRRRVRLLDVAAAGAILAIVVLLSRGALSADSLGGGGNQTALLLLPVLTCFVGAVVAARLLGPLVLVAERASRRSSTAVRLALLALARAPGRTTLACSFLVVAVGLAIFAAAYRGTLEHGASDEAGFQVPLDLTVSEGDRLALPLDAAPLGAYEALAQGVGAYPVLRRSADVSGIGASSQGVTVLGVPSAALARMSWRSDFSESSLSGLARALGADGPAALAGVALPRRAAAVRARLVARGVPLLVDLALEDGRGRVRTVRMGALPGRGEATLTARLPQRPRGGSLRVTGLELSLTQNGTAWFFHLFQEGRLVRAPDGTVVLSSLATLRSTGRVLFPIDLRTWVVNGTAASVAGRRPLRLAYSFQDFQTLVAHPPEPTDGRPLLVLASPDVARGAGPGGTLSLDLGEIQVPARIVGVARRFPTLAEDEPFVVADESRLATALDADAPGTGVPGEVWLSAPGSSAASVSARLARPPFSALDILSRRALVAAARADPFARAIGYALGVAALLALALAVVGLWLTLLGDLDDERGDHFDLEAQGATPSLLRSQARLRMVVLLGLGIAFGTILGLVLSRLVAAFVQVAAGTGAPEPPLVLHAPWGTIGLALGGLALAALAATELSLRRSFRSDVPERISWSLE